MANRLLVARGAKANRPADLRYGEFYWEKAVDGVSPGVLYMGRPDGAEADALEIGGARAMESLHFKETHMAPGAWPIDAKTGNMYLMGVDGTGLLSDFLTGDIMIRTEDNYLRINNQEVQTLNASEIVVSNAAATGLDALDVASALQELSQFRLQYAGTFDASAGIVTEAPPVIGGFYINSAEGEVEGVTYRKGDGAMYDGSVWTKIPFSEGFPADGVTYTGSTINKLSKWNSSTGELTDSIVTDNGSAVTIEGSLTTDDEIISGGAVTVTDATGTGKTKVTVADDAASNTLILPTASGTLALTTDHDEASEVSFDNTNTGVQAVNVQGAIVELEKEKLQYAGKITSAAYPVTPVLGGMYLLAGTYTIDTTDYNKGDFALYDGATWSRIESGSALAHDIGFDTTSANTSPTGKAYSEFGSDVQTVLGNLIEAKADTDGNGKLLMSQMPDTVVGGMQYMGVIDASAVAVYPAGAEKGDYYVASVAGTIDGTEFGLGDWMVYNGTNWDKVDNTESISGIKVGAEVLGGVPEITAGTGVEVSAAGGVITVGGVDAASGTKGVMSVGDGLIADAGNVSIDTGDGLKLDSTTKKITVNSGVGIGIDVNGKLSVEADASFDFNATTGVLELTKTGVTAGQHTKVTVDTFGRITAGANLALADLPISASGATGTEVLNAANGKIAAIGTIGPVAVGKSGDLITLDFTQVNATAMSAQFGVTSQTDFDFTSRTTGSETITSLMGAVNANREDLSEFIELLTTKGANAGVAAGANLVGTKGIVGITPANSVTSGANSNVQNMLEGLKAYTDSQIADYVPTDVVNSSGAGLETKLAVFIDDDTIGASNISDDGALVTVEVPVSVAGNLDIQHGAEAAKLNFINTLGRKSSIQFPETKDLSTTFNLPDVTVASTTLLAADSVIDGGDYDL